MPQAQNRAGMDGGNAHMLPLRGWEIPMAKAADAIARTENPLPAMPGCRHPPNRQKARAVARENQRKPLPASRRGMAGITAAIQRRDPAITGRRDAKRGQTMHPGAMIMAAVHRPDPQDRPAICLSDAHDMPPASGGGGVGRDRAGVVSGVSGASTTRAPVDTRQDRKFGGRARRRNRPGLPL